MFGNWSGQIFYQDHFHRMANFFTTALNISSKKSFLATPNVENECWTSCETLKSTGEMNLMVKSCLYLHKVSELSNLLSRYRFLSTKTWNCSMSYSISSYALFTPARILDRSHYGIINGSISFPISNLYIAKLDKHTNLLPPFSLIRDFRKQNTCGNVSKISVNLTCYRHVGSKSTNHSP